MSDAVISIAQRIKARDEAAVASFGTGPTPDQAARANTLSRDLELPTDFVDRNIGAVEQIALQRKAQDAIQKHPVIGDWASDPRNAAIGKDDIDNLSVTARLMSGAANIGRHVGGAFGAGITTDISSGLWGLARGVAENLTESRTTEIAREKGGSIFDPLIGFLAQQQKAGQAMSEKIAGPDPEGFVARNLKAGLRSAPLSALALGVTAATGNPALGAGVVSAQVGGQAYGQARDKGLTPGRAAIFASSQGMIEYATEKVPALKYLEDLTAGSSFTRTLVNNFIKELPQEQAATVLQDFNEWAALTPDRPFMDYIRDRPEAGLATAIATFAGTAASVTAAQGPRILVERERKKQAEADAAFLESLATGSVESKVRTRDPSAFAKFLELQANGTPAENLYIPGEKLAEYFQSQGMDWHSDSTWDFDSSVPTQLDEALGTGGDVVIKTSDFAAHVAGTPAWEALKNEVRLSPGGLSLSEASAINEDETLARIGDEFGAQLETDRAANEPRQKLYQSVRDKLTNAGFTQNAADAQAQLLTARAETRAARTGRKLTGAEYDTLTVNQVLPERLAPVVAADGLDMVIAALKGTGKASTGLSMLEFISKNGGVEDRGGDIKSMGGDRWHLRDAPITVKYKTKTGKTATRQQTTIPHRSKLIKPHDDAQASFIAGAGTQNAQSLDAVAQRAWEAGYLPEFNERPTTAEFLEVMGEELRGKPRYRPAEATQTDDMRAASEELADILAQEGIDFRKASPKEIKDTVARYQAAREGGLNQPAFHGSPHVFDKFSLDAIGTGEGAQAYGWGLYYSSRREIAEHYRDVLTQREGVSVSIEWGKAKPNEEIAELIRKAYVSLPDDGNITKEDVSTYLRGQLERATKDGVRISPIQFVYPKADVKRAIAMIDAGRVSMEKPGRLYEVDIPEDDEYLLWDAPLNEQPGEVWDNVIDAVQRRMGDPMGEELAGMFEASDMSGQDVYNWIAATFEKGEVPDGVFRTPSGRAAKMASEILHDAGIAGIKYLDGGSRTAGDGTYNYVVFDDSRVSIKSYEQSFADGPRGKISFEEGRAIIDLFAARDQSTFLHETGHLFLEELKADALSPDAPDQLKADWQAVNDWFAANGHPITDGIIPVDAHELWARGIERYLMEGKSPSTGLRKIFDMFRGWLLNIYQVVNNLRSPISPEIREVMDRLIATDEEISQAREQQNIKALFTDAAQAGMTEAEFAAYQKSTTEARDEAFDQLLYKTMQAIRQSRTKAYKDEEATVRAEVTESVDLRPEWRAMAAIKAGQRLNRQWLVDTYGEDALRLLPARVPPVYADKGVNADELAELSGFRTGDEMVRTLMGIGERTRQLREGGDQRSVRKVIIDEETQATMRERHGDPLNDGSIEEEALAVIHNEKQGEVIASELRQLGRQSNRAPTPYRIAREWAARKIAESTVVEATSGSAIQRYAKAASKAAKAAEDAMLKGDVDETFRQKQAQMLNNALVAEAKKAKDRIDIAVARLGRIAKRATMKSVDQDYLDQAHALLEQVDFRTVSQRQIDRQESFEAWANSRQAEGYDVVVPDSFAQILGKTNWSRQTIENLLGLDDAVQQIIHLGRLKKALIDGKDRREFEALRNEALAQMGGLDKRPPSNLMEPSWFDGMRSQIASLDASLLKMETVFDWLDLKNPNGVFNRIVFRPIADAQHNEQAMLREYVLKVQALTKALPKTTLRQWDRKFSDPRLLNRETGEPWVLTRDQLVSIALNMGNAGNKAKLAGGYGWNADVVMEVLNDNLTDAEWGYVQSIWDTIDSLWPKIEAMEKRLNGIAPEKIEAEPFWVGKGATAQRLSGGYYPVVYDPRKNIDSDVNAAKSGDLFENIYTRATTSRGFTKERTKVERPIHLSLGVIERHLSEVIHDLTHREAIMQADRFLSDKGIMQAVDETMGPEVRRQFRPWLQHIANEWAYDRAGLGAAERFLRGVRRNTTFVGMAFRASTVFMQAAGLSDSAGTIGGMAMVHGLAKFSKNPAKAIGFVLEKSGEVRSRMDTLDRDIRDAARRHAGKIGVLSAAQRFGYMGIGFMDRLVVVPTWIGAYDNALKAGADEGVAVAAADKAVRVSQGAGAAKDLAAVQRGRGPSGEAFKLLTMFYSYASGYYQRLRTLGRDVRKANAADIPGLAARSFFLVIAPALLAELLAGRGPDDDEDETWAGWAFQKVALSVFNPIPILRDVMPPATAAALDKPTFGYSFTPVAKMGETFVNIARDAGNVIEGEDTKRATRNFLEGAGYVTGAIPGQLAATSQFLVDVAYGDADPETFGDWWTGLTKGKFKD